VLVGEAQQKGDAEKQHHHAQAHHQIAGGEEGDARHGAVEGARRRGRPG
jgi:hypothetical protein